MQLLLFDVSCLNAIPQVKTFFFLRTLPPIHADVLLSAASNKSKIQPLLIPTSYQNSSLESFIQWTIRRSFLSFLFWFSYSQLFIQKLNGFLWKHNLNHNTCFLKGHCFLIIILRIRSKILSLDIKVHIILDLKVL